MALHEPRLSEIRRLPFWVFLGLIPLIGEALAADLSGIYVGDGTNSAFLLQIVQMSGGTLTGRFEQVWLDASGKLVREDSAVTGAANGNSIVVSIQPPGFLSSPITASGTVDGALFHLSGGGNGRSLDLNLMKSDSKQYDALVQRLAAQGQVRAAAKAQANLNARILDLTNQLTALSQVADGKLPKFASVEEGYRTITGWMSQALARQQSIFGDGQAAVARSQISVSINQAEIQAEQIHRSVETFYRDFSSRAVPLLTATTDAAKHCADPVAPAPAARCNDLMKALASFRQRVTAVEGAVAKSEEVWRREKAKQDRIIQISNNAP